MLMCLMDLLGFPLVCMDTLCEWMALHGLASPPAFQVGVLGTDGNANDTPYPGQLEPQVSQPPATHATDATYQRQLEPQVYQRPTPAANVATKIRLFISVLLCLRRAKPEINNQGKKGTPHR